ncbi:hypothetical protein GCM10027051_32920 [Niabella terrae]
MKNLLLTCGVLISTGCLAQGEITVSYVYQTEDFVEISLSMDKEINKFELIDIDSISISDNKGKLLKETREYPLNYNYNNGRAKNLRFYPPNRKIKNLNISGFMNFFVPSTKNNSYFNLGSIGAIPRNINLVDKEILKSNPNLFFSIVDSTEINKVFPNFRFRRKDSEPYQRIDFNFFDIIYAYRNDDDRKLVYFFDNNPDPGYNNLILEDKKTGIVYKLTKIKQGITPSELSNIAVEIMIENGESIKRIPFEFHKVPVKPL